MCMYVRITYIFMCVCMYVCIYVWMYVCTYVCFHACKYACVWNQTLSWRFEKKMYITYKFIKQIYIANSKAKAQFKINEDKVLNWHQFISQVSSMVMCSLSALLESSVLSRFLWCEAYFHQNVKGYNGSNPLQNIIVYIRFIYSRFTVPVHRNHDRHMYVSVG